jgi:hypothetical protein
LTFENQDEGSQEKKREEDREKGGAVMERINHSLAELIKRTEHDVTTSSSVARWLEKRPQAHLDHRSK